MNDKVSCELKWIRKAQDGDAHEERIPDAIWMRRGASHFLTYKESIDGLGEVRSTLRIDGKKLTWIRHGAMEWTHTFEAGHPHVSHMHLMGQKIEIRTETSEVDVTMTPNRGVVTVTCTMQRDDVTEDVSLVFEFHSDDAPR